LLILRKDSFSARNACTSLLPSLETAFTSTGSARTARSSSTCLPKCLTSYSRYFNLATNSLTFSSCTCSLYDLYLSLSLKIEVSLDRTALESCLERAIVLLYSLLRFSGSLRRDRSYFFWWESTALPFFGLAAEATTARSLLGTPNSAFSFYSSADAPLID
jgi:hypothetical protein